MSRVNYAYTETALPGAMDFAIRFANARKGTCFTKADAIKPDRHRRYVEFRMDVAWALRNFSKWSYPKIAVYMERDHASIIHLVRRFESGGVYLKPVNKKRKPNARYADNVRFSPEQLGA